MKRLRISSTVLVLPLLLAGVVFAQDNPHIAYQNSLLARPLSASDRNFCDGKVGAKTANNAEYDACHVTRHYVADLQAKKTQGRFAPLAHIKYCATEAEKRLLRDAV